MRDKIARFMTGRYGSDALNQILVVASLILILASMLWQPLYILALALLIFAIWRMFSRNIEKRRGEALAFERAKSKVFSFFKNGKNLILGTKTHKYYKCPQCRQQLRVPRGKGRLDITCPQCNAHFEKKT